MEVVTANRSVTLGRAKQKRNASCDGKTSKSIAQKALQRSFLNQKFDELPIFNNLTFCEYGISLKNENGKSRLILGNESIDVKSNIDRLQQCANAYCKAHNSLCTEVPQGHPFEQIRHLYKAVKSCCPADNEIIINFDYDRNELVFVEYALCDYPQYTCAFVPVKFIEGMTPPYRTFFCKFVSLIRATMKITFPEDHYDFAFSLGIIDDFDYVDKDERDDEYEKFALRYIKGDIKSLFDEIESSSWQELVLAYQCNYDRISSLISNAPNKELAELVKVAFEGIELMADESICYYRHSLNQCNLEVFNVEDDYYEDKLSIDRLCAICYGDEDNDPIVSSVIDTLNNSGYDYYPEVLYDEKLITPDYDKPFIGSDFPNRWFEYMAKYNQARWNYEQTYEIDK